MKILLYRLLDSFQSFIRRKRKEISARGNWGAEWRDMVRSGRRYSRVEFDPFGFPVPFTDTSGNEGILYQRSAYRIRPEPGWEWNCQQCKEYSFITESMMPAIIAEWAAEAKRNTDLFAAKGKQYRVPPKPTIERVGCPNCKFRPGDPE